MKKSYVNAAVGRGDSSSIFAKGELDPKTICDPNATMGTPPPGKTLGRSVLTGLQQEHQNRMVKGMTDPIRMVSAPRKGKQDAKLNPAHLWIFNRSPSQHWEFKYQR
jgi:hypothetical protein